MKILMVLTPDHQIGNIDKVTSLWFNEFAKNYYFYKDEGADITVVWSVECGPVSGSAYDEPELQTEATRRFKLDVSAQQVFEQAGLLASVSINSFDVVSYSFAYAQLSNLATDAFSVKVDKFEFIEGNEVHADRLPSGVLRLAKVVDISPLLECKRAFGFTSRVKASVNFSDIVPLLVDFIPIKNGGAYSKDADWQPYA